MKRIFLIVVFCFFPAGLSFAQDNVQAMRFLTVNALMQYGQKLYDRGDFDEAIAVFNHVLIYDRHQPQALQYLKEMGHAPVTNPITVIQPKVVKHVVAADIIVVKKSELPPLAVDLSDTESIKKAIEIKKQIVEKLQAQIKQMRANIAAESMGY